ncbi:hypothetical protein LXM60_16615 [Pandoraea sputorum]|uniref:hypothetical protein n=1 Tax=Pandoraea sputorum TaxID=93222 RepID=UPI001E4AC90C|nr:hypothetical protein [Pandoraea sputorum]MCE4061824.1 hypothetical protein [Pandoraea sputorum]
MPNAQLAREALRSINKFKKMRKIYCLMVASTLALSACAGMSDVKLDQARLQTLTTVEIIQNVTMPESGFTYEDQGKRVNRLFIGGVIAAMFPPEGEDEMTSAAQSVGVDLAAMLREKMSQSLQSKGVKVSDSGASDARIKLTVLRFSLSAQPWKMALQPIVSVKAEMVSRDGNVIWSKTRTMSNHSDSDVVPAHLLIDYRANPALLREGFSTACDIVVADLANDLAAAK